MLVVTHGTRLADIARLNDRAREVGQQVGWDLAFVVAPNPDFVGVNRRPDRIFVMGPVRLSTWPRTTSSSSWMHWNVVTGSSARMRTVTLACSDEETRLRAVPQTLSTNRS